MEREVNIVRDYHYVFMTRVKEMLEDRLKSYPGYSFSLRHEKFIYNGYSINIEKKSLAKKWHSRLYRLLVCEPPAKETKDGAYIRYREADALASIEADCRSRDIEEMILDIMRAISKLILELEVEKRMVSGNQKKVNIPSLTLNRKGYI